MANFSDSKQLNMSCTIGAIYLPKTGSIQGFQSKSRTRNNPSSSLSQSHIHQAESLGTIYTDKLTSITKGSGGFIPKLNLSIGAPACTFAEGSIGPGMIHPVLDKIRGATESQFYPGVVYKIPINNIGSTSISDSSSGDTNNIVIGAISDNGPPPSIYAKKANSVTTEVYNTYNIWTQILPSQALEIQKKFIVNLGCQNYEQLGGVHMSTQITSANTAQITVHAQQRRVILKRIFPIADDLLYNSPILSYYNGRADKRLNIKGGRNCGFHMKFNVSSVNLYTNNAQKLYLNSEIIINFGRNSTEDRTISHFSIFLNSNSNFLKYENPIDGKIYRIELQGKKLTEGLNQVFVHFAGPNMYIGFSENIEEWNVIEPINLKKPDQLQDFGSSYECRISERAEIYLVLTNVQCSFTYGPICFDNINWSQELISSSVGTTLEFSNDKSEIFRGQNCVKLRFEVSSTNESAKQSVLPQTINTELQQNSSPSKFKDRSGTDNIKYELTKTNDRSKPSVYLDWRAYNSGIFDITYYQTALNNIIRGTDNPRIITTGRLTYTSDITGSILFYTRNKYEASQSNTLSLVRDIWSGYNNVTNYLHSATVTESFLNKNQSMRKTTATLVFKNLTHDNIGRQILNAIQENVLTFTLKAGYGLNLSTYFVGVSNKVTVSRGEAGYTVTVDCEDLGFHLLNNIRFPVNNDIVLTFRPFQYILEDCFIFANLDDYYRPRERLPQGIYDPLYNEYFPTMSGSEDYNNPVHQAAITASREKKIIEALNPLLSTMMVAEARGANIGRTLPVLYFDYETLNYKLTTRGSEELEYLYFISDNIGGRQFLPQQLQDEQNIHGLGFGDWVETTDISNLHSKITFIYQDFHSANLLESDSNYIDSAVGESAYNLLNNLVSRTQNVQPYVGYVGFNKEDYYNDIKEESEGIVQSRALAKKIFDSKEIVGRKTYQSLTLKVYVNQPLRTYGLFKVQSFEGGVDVESYQEYIFDEVKYTFDITNNLITADITGSFNPDIL